LIILGIVVTLVAFAGGAWAVLASGFCADVSADDDHDFWSPWLTLRQPQIGGLSNLLARVPSAHFHWTALARTPIIALWAIAMFWFGLQAGNNPRKTRRCT